MDEILPVRLTNYFRVIFNDESHPFLTHQVTAVASDSEHLLISFQDDTRNLLVKKLCDLWGRRVKFKIELTEIEDDKELIAATWLYEGTLVGVAPNLDYSRSKAHEITTRFKIHSWNIEV